MSYLIDPISAIFGAILGVVIYWMATHIDVWFEAEPGEESKNAPSRAGQGARGTR